MEVEEVGAFARAGEGVVRLRSGRLLDLDDVRAPIGELPCGGRTGAGAGQIQDNDSIQGQAAGHGDLLRCPEDTRRRRYCGAIGSADAGAVPELAALVTPVIAAGPSNGLTVISYTMSFVLGGQPLSLTETVKRYGMPCP